MDAFAALHANISACRLCAADFAARAPGLTPRPVLWAAAQARVLITGQAPGARVHLSGQPFTDPSGARLREWLGLSEAAFYDKAQIAILPMGFCYPGTAPRGGDYPPPRRCAETWRAKALAALPARRLTLLLGHSAWDWHRRTAGAGRALPESLSDAVAAWPALSAEGLWALPHPSWRTRAWVAARPWFEAALLPALRAALQKALRPERPAHG